MVYPDIKKPHIDGSPDIKYSKIFINNRWQDSISGVTYPIINPLCDVAKGNEQDVDKAVAAAHKTFKPGSPWHTMKASQRGDLLNKLADLIERDSKYLTRLEALGTRRSLPNTYLPDVIDCYRYFAWWANTIHGRTIPADGPYRCFTLHEPLGIVGQIISGDFPLLTQAWTLGPALCAGNTVVLKPAQENPLTSLYIASLITEAGFPPGVVNIVTGDKTPGAAVATHPKINKVVFVGSTEVGRRVLCKAGVKSRKVTLMLCEAGRGSLNRGILRSQHQYEPWLWFKLGIGSTMIFVFADAHLDDAVKVSFFASYFNFSFSQPLPYTFVEESIYDAFVKKSLNWAKGYKDPDRSVIGGTIYCNHSPVKILKLDAYLSVLKNEGAMYDVAAAIFTTSICDARKVVLDLRPSIVWVNCYDAFWHQTPLRGMMQDLPLENS